MTTDVSIYLLRADCHAELPFSRPGEWREVARRAEWNGSEALRCFVKQSRQSRPRWASWLAEAFDFGRTPPVTRSAGSIVLLAESGRRFAITFGTGWQGLAKESIERDFGLIVALNQLRPERLRHLVTKTIDLRSRERSTYNHAGAEFDNFDLDVDVEWLRSAGGPSTRGDCTLLAGADALRLRGYDGELSKIPGLCGELLTIRAKGVPTVFEFADNLRPIERTALEHAALEDELLKALTISPLPSSLEVILDSGMGVEASSFELLNGRASATMRDVTRKDLEQALDRLKTSHQPLDPRSIRIRQLDGAGDEIETVPLVRVIQAELTLDGRRYIHLEGRWFSVGDNYVKTVTSRVEALPDVTQELRMPDWPSDLQEGDYNKRVASNKSWLCEDQNFLRPAAGAAVEPCDLLTQEWDFIHVKLGDRAASLHHQLGQLSGAASLLRRDPSTVAEMERRYKAKWGSGAIGNKGRFVMAIGREQHERSLFGKMLLAKISVLDQARRVRALGYGFAVARINVVASAASAGISKKRGKKKVKVPHTSKKVGRRS